MPRIAVIGCSGSGKSTFSIRLNEITNIPIYHLDKMYWKSGWVEEDRNIFIDKQKNAVNQKSWIIDGNYLSTLDMRLNSATLVIHFKIGRLKCLTGYLKRLVKNYNRSRSDITAGCSEKLDFEFMKYIWNFEKENHSRAEEILKAHPDVKMITFYSRKQADNYLKGAEKYYGEK